MALADYEDLSLGHARPGVTDIAGNTPKANQPTNFRWIFLSFARGARIRRRLNSRTTTIVALRHWRKNR